MKFNSFIYFWKQSVSFVSSGYIIRSEKQLTAGVSVSNTVASEWPVEDQLWDGSQLATT
jgi:hypothetical protein